MGKYQYGIARHGRSSREERVPMKPSSTFLRSIAFAAPFALVFTLAAGLVQAQEDRRAGRGLDSTEFGDIAVEGSLRGVVRSIDMEEGTFEVDTGAARTTVRATPEQIAELRPGQQLNVRYEQYGDRAWLKDGRRSGTRSNGDFGRTGRVTGNITDVDKVEGEVEVSVGTTNWTFRAHPEDLEDLLPGQFVEVEYRRVGDIYWLRDID
jgi:preprotein translocase subunit YajC